MRQYMRRPELAQEFGYEGQTVSKFVGIIQKHSGRGERYGPMCIVGSGKSMLVRTVAFMDAVKYGDFIGRKNFDDVVPAFQPIQLEHECGITQMSAEQGISIDAESLAKQIAEEFLRALAQKASM